MRRLFRMLFIVTVAAVTAAGTGCGPSKEDEKTNPELGPPPDIKPAKRGGPGLAPPKR